MSRPRYSVTKRERGGFRCELVVPSDGRIAATREFEADGLEWVEKCAESRSLEITVPRRRMTRARRARERARETRGRG